jgi:hypothetical protein
MVEVKNEVKKGGKRRENAGNHGIPKGAKC